MTDKEKAWIDSASYEKLLSKWRFAVVGDSMFQGETGRYYSEVMARKKAENNAVAVATSKRIGWER